MRSFKSIWLIPALLACVLLAGNAAQAAVPANNNCANATAITEVINLAFNTTEATFDGPGLRITSPNIWYVYTASCTGDVTISLEGSSYDTMLVVYSGQACSPTEGRIVAYNDDFSYPALYSEVTFAVTAGNKYLIEIGGWGSNKGSGLLSISFAVPCGGSVTNDNCANATAIGNVTNLPIDTTNSTYDGGIDCGIGPNIWYLYTAPCTGQATVTLNETNFYAFIGIYRDVLGPECPPRHKVACKIGPSGTQIQLTFDTVAGYQYQIVLGSIYSNVTGTGILNITCNGQYVSQFDLGDAPDSSNNYGLSMIAYNSTLTLAHYPTVFDDGSGFGPYGPVHLSTKTIAHLGQTVTHETEADMGLDEDVVNNINPQSKAYDQDKGDDGVIFPVSMPNCDWTTMDYIVNVITPNTDLYVNVWCDWNRDGDWDDNADTNPEMAASKGFVSEWAVQNQLLFNLPVGLNQITTPAFLSYHPEIGPSKLWMRITLSEQPWTGGSGSAGSGPEIGYEFGETEDYFFEPDKTCTVCQDFNEDGVIDLLDLVVYINQWLDVCP